MIIITDATGKLGQAITQRPLEMEMSIIEAIATSGQ